MNRGRVGEERGGKETDGCPLTRADKVWVNMLLLIVIEGISFILRGGVK
jgi:hypothetical protein